VEFIGAWSPAAVGDRRDVHLLRRDHRRRAGNNFGAIFGAFLVLACSWSCRRICRRSQRNTEESLQPP